MFHYLFHLLQSGNSCSWFTFGLTLDLVKKKEGLGQVPTGSNVRCKQTRNRLCNIFDLLFVILSPLLSCMAAPTRSIFSRHQSIYHCYSFVFYLPLAFYPSVYPSIPSCHFQTLALSPSIQRFDPWPFPAVHWGIAQWASLFKGLSEWSQKHFCSCVLEIMKTYVLRSGPLVTQGHINGRNWEISWNIGLNFVIYCFCNDFFCNLPNVL